MADMLYRNEAWLREQYIDLEKSSSEIADKAGCSHVTILKWLHAFGIPTRNKIEAMEPVRKSPKYRLKQSESHRGDKNVMRNPEIAKRNANSKRGKKFTKSRCNNISLALKGKPARNKGIPQISTRQEKNPNWKGGISFKPYCSKFNNFLKEDIRNAFGRRCFLCGAPENGERHSVHHCDYNKGQGCGNAWNLIPLCRACHTKTNSNRHHWFNLLATNWAIKYLPQ